MNTLLQKLHCVDMLRIWSIRANNLVVQVITMHLRKKQRLCNNLAGEYRAYGMHIPKSENLQRDSFCVVLLALCLRICIQFYFLPFLSMTSVSRRGMCVKCEQDKKPEWGSRYDGCKTNQVFIRVHSQQCSHCRHGWTSISAAASR